ncbi:MerR family DNA-binding transcriptional regulator [Ideonella sp. BN130291]|uniref:MerR family DNA-binding transcriptional regulator n=1 Tax=Ideonella sp. BN130291 TaxID=3112940 RepID=UPI002E265D25|nr:MerR family DNA-binding transcriptional regulator [Ideonella sp. BN130291]
MRISQLAERTGVSAHALRHYERLGLLKPRRLPSGYRDYDERVVREVVFIVMGRQMGLPLQRIAENLPAYRAGRLSHAQVIDALQQRVAELDQEISTRQQQRQALLDHVQWLVQQQKQARERSPSGATPWPKVRHTRSP